MKQARIRQSYARLLVAVVAVLAIPAAAGAVVHNVSTPWGLNTAMGSLSPGDEVVLAAGTYDLYTYAHGYWIDTPNVTIRGATGNATDVVLWGGGMNTVGAINEAIQFAAADITLKDLTIEGFWHHAVHYQPAGDRGVVDNVITKNIGCQHIKGAKWNDDIIISNSLLYQTEPRQNGLPGRPDNYVGGIDLHGARRAQIHDNVVMDIIGMGDAGDGLIFMWNESQDCVVERNVVIGGCKGIELGNPSDQGVWQVQRTIVRNNFVLSRPNEDIGVELCYTLDCEVYNNTIYRTGDPWSADWGRTIHVYDKVAHPTTNLQIKNNIIRGGCLDNSSGDWSAAAIAAMGNIVDTAGTLVTSAWFVDPDNLDLHLTELATAAFDAGVPLADVLFDFDGGPRPAEGGYDMGADEYASPMGDANRDGNVDLLDLTIIANNWELSGKNWGLGDFNRDGNVDLLDLTLLANNWGFVGVAAPAPVPEPATIALLALGAAALLRRRR